MRFLFCLVPALIVGIIPAVIHPALGAIFFLGVFGFSWDVTRPDGQRRTDGVK